MPVVPSSDEENLATEVVGGPVAAFRKVHFKQKWP